MTRFKQLTPTATQTSINDQQQKMCSIMYLLVSIALVLFTTTTAFKAGRETMSMIVRGKESLGLVEKMPGRSNLNNKVFDPLGFSQNVSPKQLLLWREVELKHGRVAMLAAVGFLVAEARPFSALFNGRVGGPAIYHMQEIRNIAPYFWIWGLLAIAMFEVYSINETWENQKERTQVRSMMKSSHIPGDLNFDPFSLCPPIREGSGDVFDRMSGEFIDKR